jgi:hypothetical protein
MNKSETGAGKSPSELITGMIAGLGDWRGKLLARLRKLVLSAAPGIQEEWKWGTAVWTQDGMVCSAAAFKDHVKINFFKGASLKDPRRLFNAGLEAKTTRAVDFGEGDPVDEAALKDLVRAAVAFNQAGGKKK